MSFLVHRLYKELQQDGSRATFGSSTSFLRLALAVFTPALSSVATVRLAMNNVVTVACVAPYIATPKLV